VPDLGRIKYRQRQECEKTASTKSELRSGSVEKSAEEPTAETAGACAVNGFLSCKSAIPINANWVARRQPPQEKT
jgi:hypothetical protein